MTTVRLRTQLVLVTVLISSAMTGISLFIVRQSVRAELRRQSIEASRASVRAFERINREYEADLLRTAALLAELPTLKALMTTGHRATIQDASRQFWDLSGTDLFVLTGPEHERVSGVHVASAEPHTEAIERTLLRSSMLAEKPDWWQDGTELFRVVERPIIAEAGPEQHILGYLIVGRRISTGFAQQIGHLSGSEIALASSESIVASTLGAHGSAELAKRLAQPIATEPQESRIEGEPYEISAISLETDSPTPLRCYILLPLGSSYAFLDHLNRVILVLGLLAALSGAVLVTIVARAMTNPLDRLVRAVRALATGDYSYSVETGGSLEVAELARDFTLMREQLVDMQRRRIESERLAALGRAAGSLSHDLRHHLAALVANAEFLHDADCLGFDRDEIYREIERASAQMTTLIDSLLEVSRDRVALSVSEGDLKDVVIRAAEAVRSNPEFRSRRIEIHTDVPTSGVFDAPKLERAFFNLVRNACEATSVYGRVGVTVTGDDKRLQCLVWDTGDGIPEEIRESLFEPFVSAGKNKGTGLGLAITAKIIHDHGGEIRVEQTSPGGTTFRVTIPRRCADIRSDAAKMLA